MNTQTDDTDQPTVDELTMLKQRAKVMGITFSNNIGVDALRAKINAKMEGQADQTDENGAPKQELNPLTAVDGLPPQPAVPVKEKSLRDQLVEEQMRLVRLRITNLDPKKKDLPGEIFAVANRYIGNVRKYVPYGEVTDEGYHVPYCIYTMLKEKKFLSIRTRDRNRPGENQPLVETRWVNEFALEVLPPLTQEELDRLATAQAAAGVFAS